MPGKIIVPILLALLCAVLYFSNLGGWYLWQDEANAALLAENILSFGYPAAFNGKNAVWAAQSDVSPLTHYYILWGWLPLYLNAACFGLLGTGTVTARLASVLLASALVLLSYRALRVSRLPRKAAGLFSLLLVTCVPLTLYMRQCGYYAATVVFSCMAFYVLHMMEPGRKRTLLFAGASCALVNTQVMIWGVVMAGLFAGTLFAGGRRLRDLKLFAVSALGALPFLLLYQVWRLADRSDAGSGVAGSLEYVGRLQFYADALMTIFFPAWYLAAVLIGALLVRRSFTKPESDILFRGLVLSTVALVLVPLVTSFNYVRYIIFIVPVLFLLLTIVHVRILQVHRTAGLLLLGALMVVSVAGVRKGNDGLVCLAANFLRELRHNGVDANEALSSYLSEHADPADIVLCNYGDFPVQFYTGLRVRGGPGGIGLSPNRCFPEKGITQVSWPEWIILRRHWKLPWQKAIEPVAATAGLYERIVLPVEDTKWGNRPSLYYHYFTAPAVSNPLVIYRLKRQP